MGHGPGLTSPAGKFRFEALTPGAYTVRVAAAGYAEREVAIDVEDAESLLVMLQPAPFQFDTLAVDLRTLEIRGLVRDRASGTRLARTEIVTSLVRGTATDLFGQFRIEGVPAMEPLVMGVRAFGYLPVDSLVRNGDEREGELTGEIVFEVEPDPVVDRMIEIEVERLEERARPHRSALMRTMDRSKLLEQGQRRTARVPSAMLQGR